MAQERLAARLQAVLQQIRPGSVLAIGAPLVRRIEAMTGGEAVTTCLSSAEATERLGSLEVHDLAFIQVDEALPVAGGCALLARLRDLHARKVLVIVAAHLNHTPWDRRSLIGLGFTPHGEAVDEAGERLLLYQFDIATYKTTPDWLSPEHWANPELWDKYRW